MVLPRSHGCSRGRAIVEEKGQPETYQPAAREVFQRIVDDYPNSDRVAEAQRQLEKLKR